MRRAALGALLVVGMMVAGSPAAAQQEIIVEGTGWYSSLTVDVGTPLGDPVANATLEQSDVPIGAFGTTEHKRSYLQLSIPAGATSAVIELPLSETTGASFGVPGPILACPVAEEAFVQRGGDIAQAPEIDCGEEPVVGEPNAELIEGETATAFIFDLEPILAVWNAGGPGQGVIALVADVREPQPLYQITFRADLFDTVGTAGGTTADDIPPFDVDVDGGFEADDREAFNGGFAAPVPAPFAPFSPTDPGPSSQVPPGPQIAGPPPAEPQLAASPAAGPPGGIPPVNPLAWLIALPLSAAMLFASGRALRTAGDTPSALDRLLDTQPSPPEAAADSLSSTSGRE